MAEYCFICKSKEYETINDKKIDKISFQNVKCGNCGFVYTLGKNELLEKVIDFLYSGEGYYKKKKYFSTFKKCFHSLIEWTGLRYANPKSQINLILKYLKKQKEISFLDIGCGFGQTLKYLDKVDNFSIIEGVEMNQFLVNDINNKCIKSKAIKIESIEKFLYEDDKKYDIIFLAHVLEHFIAPNIILRKLKQKLNKDGLIYIEIPNCGDRRTLKLSLNLREHLSHFTKKNVRNLLEKERYKVVLSGFYEMVYMHSGKINFFQQLLFYLTYFFYRKKNICRENTEKNSSLLKILISN